MSRKWINTAKHVHSQRIETWLGAERAEALSRSMRDFYWPVHLLDVPGSVRIMPGGDFVGGFDRGVAGSAMDWLRDYTYRLWRAAGRPSHGMVNAGFASIGDALARASSGDQQHLNGGQIFKSGPTGVANVTSSLWRVGTMPAAGAAGSAAPGGRIPTSATTGAMAFANPASGTLHLTGADVYCSVAGNALLMYDRIFDVAKTMNSTATEAVTGVPTRYQSTTAGAMDYVGGNFLFVEVGTPALAATAHNWTVCTYLDQANASSTLPSLTGNSGAIVDRLDHPTNQFFAPLESGDTGVKALTQMQCSAAVATGVINFVIGHPIGVMALPFAGVTAPFDWLTNRQLAPRIFDSACLALLELVKPSTTATTYGGMMYATRALP